MLESAESVRPVYLIVHGGFDGGWTWRDVAKRMWGAGAEVYCPSLTGLGDRTHLMSQDVGLETHIQDIVNVVIYSDLKDVILVGHSYGGVVTTGVAQRIPERLARVVYLDAVVLEDGENMLDAVGEDFANWLTSRANELGDGWRVVHDPPDDDRKSDFPLLAAQERLSAASVPAKELLHTFIRCTESGIPMLEEMATRARGRGWEYLEIESDHMPMLSVPQEITSLLLSLQDGV
ncbi:MAG: alpha/beta hydrolase [Gemmatimonadetes bacterium]|jgi:pimeloyl-ACP methyl ester carboxylesterase|nr:alpha/beta hydrolase [Gemmatimonadota bacterium]MBT7862637.1 alpha/beta hydrolase [Gemmatimonadota bacterium]